MAKRKRPTRAAPLSVALPKPRNAVLQAAVLGQVKLGTAKHEKSKGALRRAQNMALRKAARAQPED